MTTFAQAHPGDEIQVADPESGWTAPLLILTEPQRCEPGCLRCRGITRLGRVVPVHAHADRLIRVLVYGPASECDATGEVVAEHADKPTFTPWAAADEPESFADRSDYTPIDEGDEQ